MTIDGINIDPLLRACDNFEEFRRNLHSKQEKAGSIQAFECCFELLWKRMQRLLQARGRTTGSPRETFRIAAIEGFIDDPEVWFDFLKKRNITVHTYDEANADEVITVFPEFSHQVAQFLDRIQSKT